MNALVREKLLAEGITQDISDLICEEYTDEDIEEDAKAIDYDFAYEEAHKLEDKKKKEQIQ